MWIYRYFDKHASLIGKLAGGLYALVLVVVMLFFLGMLLWEML